MLLNKKIPAGYIFRKIKHEILYVLIIGLLVYLLTKEFNHLLPVMPITIPTFIGTAISVILSFKLSQSYERWWEARKIWGSIVNDSRNLIIQLQSFVQNDDETVRRIALRQICWSYTLGDTLRGLDPNERFKNYLSPADVEFVHQHTNKALAILQLNAQDIAALKQREQIDVFSHVQINNTIMSLTNSMGMVERIKNTVFPVTYKYFLHMIIYLFVITLSVALRDIASYFEIPLLLVISCAFFLLEKTATHLQDPFSNRPTDTAMTTIANTIETNICELVKMPKKTQPVVSDTFYVL